MNTVVNAEAAVLAFYEIRFIATASNVIQPNSSITGTVEVTDKLSNVSVYSNQPQMINIDSADKMYSDSRLSCYHYKLLNKKLVSR